MGTLGYLTAESSVGERPEAGRLDFPTLYITGSSFSWLTATPSRFIHQSIKRLLT